MAVLKYQDPNDLQWYPISMAADGETWVGPDQPANPAYDLWIDTDEVVPSDGGFVPVGAVMAFGGTVAPAGWHLCDGTAHGSDALLAVIGSANTPNLRDKFIVGAGTTYADKATGGAATVTLSAAQSGTTAHGHGTSVATSLNNAAHSHGTATVAAAANHGHTAGTGNDTPDHAHAVSGYTPNPGTGANYYVATMGTDVYGSYSSAGANARHTHSVTVYAGDANHAHTINSDNANHGHTFTPSTSTAAAASAAHENLPPYYALTYIIKK